jgi:hypothetical protein
MQRATIVFGDALGARDIHQQRVPGKSLAEVARNETRSSEPGNATQPAAKENPEMAHTYSTANKCSASELRSGGFPAKRDGKPNCPILTAKA